MFNPDPEYFWAIPDVSMLEPQQKELNDTRTQASRHRAIALLKFLYRRGTIKEEELTKFLSGIVGPAVAVEQEAENIANAIVTLQPHIPPDLRAEALGILSDMRETLGFSQNQEGAFSPYHGKTATETMTVEQGFEVRVDERKDLVADLLVRIVRKWNQMIFRLWTQEKVVRIVSPQGEPFWINYTGDQLRGDYLLTIDPDSGMPVSKGLKYQMGKELMELFGGDMLIDQIGLRQVVLENYDAVDPRVSRLLSATPGMSPMAIAAARQPTPMQGGGGKGAGGGRQGSSPEKPMDLTAFKTKMQGGTK